METSILETPEPSKARLGPAKQNVSLGKDKNELKVEFSERDEGFLNLVKTALWEQSETEMAGFRIEHPETSKPVFFLKVKSGKDAKKVWNEALNLISEQMDEFGKEVKQMK